MAGWVVVRVTVTKSTGERNKWQDMSLKVSQFYFAYCNIQLTKNLSFLQGSAHGGRGWSHATTTTLTRPRPKFSDHLN